MLVRLNPISSFVSLTFRTGENSEGKIETQHSGDHSISCDGNNRRKCCGSIGRDPGLEREV